MSPRRARGSQGSQGCGNLNAVEAGSGSKHGSPDYQQGVKSGGGEANPRAGRGEARGGAGRGGRGGEVGGIPPAPGAGASLSSFGPPSPSAPAVDQP